MVIRCKIIDPSNHRRGKLSGVSPAIWDAGTAASSPSSTWFFLGLTIWDEVVYRTGDNAVQNILAVQRGMTANILNIAASAYVILEGVMLAQWLKERDQRKQREALEQAREEAQEERKKWLAWYERWQDAQRAGRPFDEPPPTAPQDRDGK